MAKRLAYYYRPAILPFLDPGFAQIVPELAEHPKENVVAKAGIEPATQGFSVLCSTN
jgi:hypothetical protein